MLYGKLPYEQIEQLRPLIEEIVNNQVALAMSRFSELYEQSLKRQKTEKYYNIKTLCDAISRTRQQVRNWELGKVHNINISEYITRNGRLKLYDVEGIKAYLKRKNRLI
ncbi:hypothetical protein [Sediminibacterium sp. TEGAF015]|uniref:hypothetical protein n=1 Tax=Sediminibacterium sp. TEGAF015 TaxID=575378 RepID=UPI0022009BAA|nr:hypothetical protein [Sediminibacterium sp. TEGAF015]BDQ11694.1 hypothetical protein TEGAF0_09110 [Sediminibacterium sp. TEGAF015]